MCWSKHLWWGSEVMSLLGQSLKMKYPPWFVVISTMTGIQDPGSYLLTIVPVANFPEYEFEKWDWEGPAGHLEEPRGSWGSRSKDPRISHTVRHFHSTEHPNLYKEHHHNVDLSVFPQPSLGKVFKNISTIRKRIPVYCLTMLSICISVYIYYQSTLSDYTKYFFYRTFL